MTKRDVSIRDIARLAGVSVSTVSRVINETGRYSPQTAAKVRAIVAEQNYEPDAVAKSLRTRRTNIIGIVVPDITNEFFALITLAAQRSLEAAGFAAVICNTAESQLTQSGQLNMLRSIKVAGIIFISGEDIDGDELSDRIPKVFADRIPWNAAPLGAITVRADNFSGGKIATSRMLDAGCRRIAFLTDGRGLSTQVARYSGYQAAHREAGVDPPRQLYRTVCEVSVAAAEQAVTQMIVQKVDFDGICCYCDTLAVGALRALAAAGISVPQQVCVTGFDDISVAALCSPPLTTVRQPAAEMGELCAELIIAQRGGEKPEKTEYVLPVTLVERTSVK